MHTVSTLKDRRQRQRLAQRRHVAKLRAKKSPRRDDVARALVRAMRKCVADRVFELALPEFKAVLKTAIADLESHGFDRAEASRRLASALLSPEAIAQQVMAPKGSLVPPLLPGLVTLFQRITC